MLLNVSTPLQFIGKYCIVIYVVCFTLLLLIALVTSYFTISYVQNICRAYKI